MPSQIFTDQLLKFKAMAVLRLLTRPRAWWHWKNSKEALLKTGKLKPKSNQKSVLFYAIHKSGSTVSGKIAGEIAEYSGLTKIDWEGYFATTEPERKKILFSDHHLNKLFYPNGFMFCTLRNYLPVPDEDLYKIVLQVRDPRDVLTSHYFSMTQSHPVLTKDYLNRKIAALHKTIDEHVTDTCPRFLETYNGFIKGLSGKPNAIVLKYEDMVLDNEKWITSICTHLEIDASSDFILQLKKQYTFKNKAENPRQHIRKITPGDYKEKLKKNTIEWLNKQFEDVLRHYNYPIK